MIRLDLLGPPSLTIDGGAPPPELLWRKNLGLLAYLYGTGARGATRAHLLDLLWGEKPEGAARHSLNEALRVIRRGLGDASVDTTGDRVRLAATIASDQSEVQACLATEDAAGAAARIRGRFMEGFEIPGATAFEDWLGATRLEWARRGSDLLAAAAERLLGRGDAAAAAELAARGARLDPGNTQAAMVAMRALALIDDRAGALRLHDEFLAVGVVADGRAPPAMAALATRIRSGRSGPDRSAAEAGQPRRPPLVGREEQLAALLGVSAAACAGGARLGLIRGEPGTGKSRFLEELLARVALDGATAIGLRAVPADLTDPGGGLRALASGPLVSAPGVAAASGAALAAMAEVHPRWAEQFPGARGAAPQPLRQAVVELMRAATAEAPLVIAVDDGQWLDAESLEAFLGLLRDLAPDRFLLVIAASPRPDRQHLDDALAHVGRELKGAVVTLPPLPIPALERLVGWAMPAYDPEQCDRLTRRIAVDSAGLPFLAVELLRAVVGGLDLLGEPVAWPQPFHTLDQTRPGDLPDSIAAALRIDFRRLTPAAQQVLAAAAVLGDRVPVERLQRATGLDQEALAGALDELEWNRWLLAEPRGYSPVARVAHEVICRDLVTPGQRRRLEDAADTA